MCSIEEAWSGQLFNDKPVQSQSDLHRKYMDIPDNIFQRDNNFSVAGSMPTPRMDNYGINTQAHRVKPNTQTVSMNNSSNSVDISFSPQPMNISSYGGLNPRPEYMSIYDNANSQEQFSNLNEAFNIEKMYNTTTNSHTNTNTNTNNYLLNEDNDMDRMVFNKKLENMKRNENMSDISADKIVNSQHNQMDINSTLHDILRRIDNLEMEMKNSQTRNMYDMVLYVLVGILIAFIIYNIFRK